MRVYIECPTSNLSDSRLGKHALAIDVGMMVV
jgi:hypothetical protein